MTYSGDCVRLAVTESSHVGEVRRCVARICADAALDESAAGKAALLATELATNLVKHAKGTGELLIQRIWSQDMAGLDLISIDRGPGIPNFPRSMADGFSTAGSPGNGLGAIRRKADTFQYSTAAGQGSVFIARLWGRIAPFDGWWGAISVPVTGEQLCGDRWCIVESAGRTLVMVADGLGHGPAAHEAAAVAVNVFQEHCRRSPAEILDFTHRAMRATRGAAVAIAALDPGRGVLDYAGIGNIGASILVGETSRSLVSQNGTVGHEVRKIQQFAYPWGANSVLVMHSDGLSSRWLAHNNPGMEFRQPNLLAALLYREYARSRDDATVVLVRDKGSH